MNICIGTEKIREEICLCFGVWLYFSIFFFFLRLKQTYKDSSKHTESLSFSGRACKSSPTHHTHSLACRLGWYGLCGGGVVQPMDRTVISTVADHHAMALHMGKSEYVPGDHPGFPDKPQQNKRYKNMSGVTQNDMTKMAAALIVALAEGGAPASSIWLAFEGNPMKPGAFEVLDFMSLVATLTQRGVMTNRGYFLELTEAGHGLAKRIESAMDKAQAKVEGRN